jgi:phosphopantothenoylcysteine decarboxylase/phosphopantothenate--cysteine ligase
MVKRQLHFLITAGGTREYIDPVRFISNASSGKMGYALAGAAKKAGHKVTLISASDLQPPVGVDFVGVDTAAEMFAVVKKNFPKCDCLIMAAAVADYTPVNVHKTKIKKTHAPLTLKLKPTKDILGWAGKNKKKKQLVIGFALEDKNPRINAQKKLVDKNLDMIIANKPEAIGSNETEVQIKSANGRWLRLIKTTKTAAARKIIELVDNSLTLPGG